MQLYILAPLILIPLYKWRKKFVAVILFLVVASCSHAFYIIMKEELNIMKALETIANATHEKFFGLYYGIYFRAAPWLLGVLLAYWIINLKGERFELPKLAVVAGWICSSLIILAVIFGPYNDQQILAEKDVVGNAFYGSLSRIGWSLCVLWIIFACHQGYGGLLDPFLSYCVWNVLGRFTYAIYLSHPIIQLTIIGSSRDYEVFGTYASFQRMWRDFGLIMTISIFLVLIFESPIVLLEKALLRPAHKKAKANGNPAQVTCPDESHENGKMSSRL